MQRLNYYHKAKQYNDRALSRVLYPTNCALELDGKFLKAVGNRKRSVNLHLLSYERQKEFFMLDNHFNENLVAMHHDKITMRNKE